MDCNPTLATIRGWVTIVAMDLDIAPRTMSFVSLFPRITSATRVERLTESLQRLQVRLSRVDNLS